MGYLTLDEENKFVFTCPIFNVETKMASCIKLRTMYWKGRRPEQRKGCQACMEAGKCPAAQIAQKMAMSGHRGRIPDDYGSLTPVKGKLRKPLLERILNTMVTHSMMQRAGATEVERSMISTANDRIRKALGFAPEEGAVKSTKQPKRAPKSAPKTSTRVEDAAKSGDLSAAIE